MVYSVPTLMCCGVTVIVSPLLMLMHDQVLRLREKGINTCYINSMLNNLEKEEIIANLGRDDCDYKIIITSPEIIVTPKFIKLLRKLSRRRKLNFVAVDEAHCIDS